MGNSGEDLVAPDNVLQMPTGPKKSGAESPTSQAVEQLTRSPEMVVVEDDTVLHPQIDANTVFYIKCLDEKYELYTRFFDALLIKRQSHSAFFRDLKAFREQHQIISLLQKASLDKKQYKEVTLLFLGSRFAHPWCRKTPLKKGFWRAEWGTIEGKKKDADIAREEDHLHKLLVPIWVIMRVKMFPEPEMLRKFCEEEHERRRTQQENRLTSSALLQQQAQIESPDEPDSDSEDEAREQEEREHAEARHAATSAFRLAAAGLIITKTPKRKLRWLVKKP